MNNNRPSEILKEMSELFEKKNAQYKSNWRQTAPFIKALFPEGIKLESESDINRFQFVLMIGTKLLRYSNNWKTPHKDSIQDLIVYAALLDACDDELEIKSKNNEGCVVDKDLINDTKDAFKYASDLIGKTKHAKEIEARKRPSCFWSLPTVEEKALHGCDDCLHHIECLTKEKL